MPFIAFQDSTPTEFEHKISEKQIMKKYASLAAFLTAVFFDSFTFFFFFSKSFISFFKVLFTQKIQQKIQLNL